MRLRTLLTTVSVAAFAVSAFSANWSAEAQAEKAEALQMAKDLASQKLNTNDNSTLADELFGEAKDQAQLSNLNIQQVKHSANTIDFPSKENQILNWQSLPAHEAYSLFKEFGREMPAELSQQFNQSNVVNPYNDSDRQAGGSPDNALPIMATDPGDVFNDSGNTAILSNYLGSVPFGSIGGCPSTHGFDANDAWYSFSLTTATEVTVATCGGVYNYDTRLGIFNPDLELVTGNDDNCGNVDPEWYLSNLTCCLGPGDYFVVVDGFATYAGEYDLTVSFADCAVSDPPTRGGADNFGYTWINSADVDGPDHQWSDITTLSSGSAVEVTLSDDSYTTTAITMNQPFRFYGVEYTDLYIGSNGILGFAADNMQWRHGTVLPDAAIPNNIIAPFWDDLNPSAGGTIHYWDNFYEDRFFIQFTNIPAYNTGGLYSFQVILHKGGDIVIHYLDLQDDDISQATVGIENSDGTDGLTVNFDGLGAALADLSSLRFNYPRPTSGGPDAFGYSWINSNGYNGPEFSFTDISAGGILGITNDDQGVVQALPFSFPFYGVDYTELYISSNGHLAFDGSGTNSYTNVAIPSGSTPNAAIFPFWDDMDPGEGGTVHYLDDSANNRVIFQWQQVAHNYDFIFPGGYLSQFTHQTVLYSDGTIEINYLDMSENYLASNSIGLENQDGTIGLQVSHDGYGGTLADNTTILFTPPVPAAPRPTSGSGDEFGWINSEDPQGPDFLWEDISTTGIDIGITGDDQVVVQALSFDYPFYNTAYNSVGVSSNGWISFDTATPSGFFNDPIPDASDVNNAIFPFWDDLYPAYGGNIFYLDDAANGRAIFQWNEIRHIGQPGDSSYTFQAMLYTNGEIYVNYANMDDVPFYGLNTASVGVENAGGSLGMQVNYNDAGGLIADGVTLLMYPTSTGPIMPITDLQIIPESYSPDFSNIYLHYEWSPIISDIYGRPVEIDHYDFYYSVGDAYAEFPAGWSYWNSYTDPFTPSIPHNALVNIYARFVAVAVDGSPAASSRVMPLNESMRFVGGEVEQDTGSMSR
jgi:hypothetical protein